MSLLNTVFWVSDAVLLEDFMEAHSTIIQLSRSDAIGFKLNGLFCIVEIIPRQSAYSLLDTRV